MPASELAVILDTRVVVAAVDFNDEDWRETVAHAAHHAQTRQSKVHLVHVLAQTSWLMRKVLDDASVGALEQEQSQAAQRRLSATAEAVNARGIPATFELRTGKATAQILAVIAEQNAGLVVIGVGKPSATAMLIGGTADRLLRTARVPVLVRGPKSPTPIETILVPTGLGPSGLAALDCAAGLVAGVDGGRVFALHMVSMPGVMRAYSGDVNKLRAAMEGEARSQLQAHIANVSSDADIRPVLGTKLDTVPAEQTILSEARDRQVDLICMALGGRSLRAGPVIGRVSDRVIRALPCPLLGLPDAWIDARRRG